MPPVSVSASELSWGGSGHLGAAGVHADQVTSRRGPYFLNVLARLAPGVTLEQSRAHMNALAQGSSASCVVIVVQTVRMAAGTSVSRRRKRDRWRCAACVAGAAVFSRVAAADRVCERGKFIVDAFGEAAEGTRDTGSARRESLADCQAVVGEGIVLATLAAAWGCVCELGNLVLAALGPTFCHVRRK